ncbi:MAG TPA: hypothetical protein EYO59_03345 [Chromatiaceae bacterium]|nr:hypothetical protein [Chromatiaceae bacterium]
MYVPPPPPPYYYFPRRRPLPLGYIGQEWVDSSADWVRESTEEVLEDVGEAMGEGACWVLDAIGIRGWLVELSDWIDESEWGDEFFANVLKSMMGEFFLTLAVECDLGKALRDTACLASIKLEALIIIGKFMMAYSAITTAGAAAATGGPGAIIGGVQLGAGTTLVALSAALKAFLGPICENRWPTFDDLNEVWKALVAYNDFGGADMPSPPPSVQQAIEDGKKAEKVLKEYEEVLEDAGEEIGKIKAAAQGIEESVSAFGINFSAAEVETALQAEADTADAMATCIAQGLVPGINSKRFWECVAHEMKKIKGARLAEERQAAKSAGYVTFQDAPWQPVLTASALPTGTFDRVVEERQAAQLGYRTFADAPWLTLLTASALPRGTLDRLVANVVLLPPRRINPSPPPAPPPIPEGARGSDPIAPNPPSKLPLGIAAIALGILGFLYFSDKKK